MCLHRSMFDGWLTVNHVSKIRYVGRWYAVAVQNMLCFMCGTLLPRLNAHSRSLRLVVRAPLFFVPRPSARALADKTPDEVRREFSIKEPFSPEVERTLREENKWSTEPPIGS